DVTDLQAGVITGRVFLDGASPSGFEVRASSWSNIKVADDGRFRLPVRAGAHELCFSGISISGTSGGERQSLWYVPGTIQVAPGATVEQVFELRSSSLTL